MYKRTFFVPGPNISKNFYKAVQKYVSMAASICCVELMDDKGR